MHSKNLGGLLPTKRLLLPHISSSFYALVHQMESMVASDSEYSSSCVVELINCEEHDEWSINPTNLSSLDEVDSLEDYISKNCPLSYDTPSFEERGLTMQEMDVEFPFPIVSGDGINDLMGEICNFSKDMEKSVIPKCPKLSFDEKMFKALHHCMQWSGWGTLAQVWVPMRNGDDYVLSTSEQPFLHDGRLSKYREISRLFTFPAKLGTSSFLGLPGRVFTSKVPEWTSNVMYYNKAEYLRVEHAIDQDVRGSIALPVFEDSLHERSCCAVLEIVTTEEKSNFDLEMDNICRALQVVDLSCTRPPPYLSLESLSSNQKATLAEIKDILYAVCHAHRLPLALTWIYCSYTKNNVGGKNISPNEIPILCLEKTSSYWKDAHMEEFVNACTNHFLEEGKGLVGKALQLNEPFFYTDVKNFHVSEYPLVHHARRLGLRAAVAIKLKSTYSRGDDYILEFFLPVNMERDKDQLLLVNNLLDHIERICASLSKISNIDLVEEKKPDILLLNYKTEDLSAAELLNDELHSSNREATKLYEITEISKNDPPKQMTIEFSRHKEKKQNTSEKNINLSVLQQYFSGSLKDAAKSLGVCPTTLKRICRQHGISRWPSRKIRKVDYSLKKIQSMLESVPGMKGGLEFDPTERRVVASFSMAGEEFDHGNNLSLTNKSSLSECSDLVVRNSVISEVIDVEREVVPKQSICCSSKGMTIRDESRLAALDAKRSWPASLNTVPWMTPPTTPHDSFLSKAGSSGWKSCWGSDKTKNFESDYVFRCSSSIIGGDKIDNKMNYDSKQASSDITISSSVSESMLMMNVSSSSSESFDEKSPLRREVNYGYGGTKITVKATLGEDTVRFKFEPDAGCFELYSEVAKRFELKVGEFQLRYLDDDEEWVLLVTDSDLLECLYVLEVLQTRTVKFGVVSHRKTHV